jgi:hypothetical protein
MAKLMLVWVRQSDAGKIENSACIYHQTSYNVYMREIVQFVSVPG